MDRKSDLPKAEDDIRPLDDQELELTAGGDSTPNWTDPPGP